MMAVANDEWNGELTQFLDRPPSRPCLVPPAPSFCSVCGSINGTVARPCKFYALRHERERGQTFIELQPKRRADTFEIEIDFEEEEDELPGAPMFEYSRPAPTTLKVKAGPAAAPAARMPAPAPRPVEPEIYEAEVVEVVEEPPAAPASKPAPAEDGEALARAEAEARRLEAEFLEKQARAERERELAGQAELEKQARAERERELAEQAELEKQTRAERERELAEQAELERKALQEARDRDAAKAAPPPRLPEDQKLSREEEERLEREIEEELAKAGLAPSQEGRAPASEATGGRPIPSDRVIAPIYSQPILKIIPPEGEGPKAQPLPPPPPPPPPEAPAQLPPKVEPPAGPSVPEEPARAPEPEKPAPPEQGPVQPAAPAPKEQAPAPGQRRTGGLYGIFRKAPKEQPKPDAGKNGVDDELAKRLKKDAK